MACLYLSLGRRYENIGFFLLLSGVFHFASCVMSSVDSTVPTASWPPTCSSILHIALLHFGWNHRQTASQIPFLLPLKGYGKSCPRNAQWQLSACCFRALKWQVKQLACCIYAVFLTIAHISGSYADKCGCYVPQVPFVETARIQPSMHPKHPVFQILSASSIVPSLLCSKADYSAFSNES